MTHPRFFGYGSLVNLATHDYPDPRPARLSGWRRVWRHSALRPAAFLSVEPDADSVIHGITASVPDDDWVALDAREHAYHRVDISTVVHHPCGTKSPTAVYEAAHGALAPPSVNFPILLSYVDVVVQGYLNVYGPEGAEAFFETTAGWDAPILNDRSQPRYPRHQQLSDHDRSYVDVRLAGLSARVQQPE